MGLDKNQPFSHNSIFLPVFFTKLQKFTNLYSAYAFWRDFALIYVIYQAFKKIVKSKMADPSWQISRHHQQKFYYHEEQAVGYLINVNLCRCALLEPPPPQLAPRWWYGFACTSEGKALQVAGGGRREGLKT